MIWNATGAGFKVSGVDPRAGQKGKMLRRIPCAEMLHEWRDPGGK